MKKCCFLTLSLSFALSVSAQTQQGYVKTLGRPNQQGRALSGVSIRVKGGHNAVLSGQDGKFEMPLPGKKVGDAFSLQQVQKQGYEFIGWNKTTDADGNVVYMAVWKKADAPGTVPSRTTPASGQVVPAGTPSSTRGVDTGDDNYTVMWIVMAAAAAGAAVAAAVAMRRRKGEEE